MHGHSLGVDLEDVDVLNKHIRLRLLYVGAELVNVIVFYVHGLRLSLSRTRVVPVAVLLQQAFIHITPRGCGGVVKREQIRGRSKLWTLYTVITLNVKHLLSLRTFSAAAYPAPVLIPARYDDVDTAHGRSRICFCSLY